MFKKISLFVFALLILAPAAQAQFIGLGPHLGFQKADGADDVGVYVGATLRLKLSAALKAEGTISYRQESNDSQSLTVRSWPIMASGLIYPLPIVYGAVGAGWHNTTFDFDEDAVPFEDETKREFGWHFGAGLDIPIGAKTRLTGDIRFVFIDFEFENIPILNVDGDFYVISAGVLFGL